MALHPTVITYTGDQGTTLSMLVYWADDLTQGTAKFRKWARCPICGLDFPINKMVKIQGSLVCIPNGCYRDTENKWR